MDRSGKAPMACLWELEWEGHRLACRVYRVGPSLELRLESSRATVLHEPFRMQPRALARAHALRDSLKRRGWRDAGTAGTTPARHDPRET